MQRIDLIFGGAVSFLLGVFLAGFGLVWYFAAVFFLLLLFIFYLLLNIKPSAKHAVLFLFIFAFGIFYFHLYFNFKAAGEHLDFNRPVAFSGIVTTEPQFTDNSEQFTVRIEQPLSGDVKIVTQRVPEYHYGDRLHMQGEIAPAATLTDIPTSVFPSITYINSGNGFWIKEKLIAWKSAMIEGYRKTLPYDASALMQGIMFGTQSDFSKDFKLQMRASGTTHIVALSGYNISILVVAVALVLGSWFSRRVMFIATTAIIALFVLMVGATASVVRAAIMGFLALFAREAGRLPSPRNAIALTAAFMALLNPGVLANDIGFELSFLSLLGITYILPLIENGFPKLTKESLLGWRENIATTLSAQSAVFPVAIHYFGQFSFSSVFANALILGIMPFTMLIGFILAAANLIFLPLGALLAYAVQIPLEYMLFVIRFFANARIPLDIQTDSVAFIVIYYAILLCVLLWFSPKESPKKPVK